jgi:hypothetical protein
MGASSTTAILEVTSGADAGRNIEIGEGRSLQVGRGADADVAISDDPSLSRIHFTLRHAGAALVLEDLGSRNGTLVNGARVSRHTLSDGDTIVAGDTRFGVRLVRAVAQGTTTAIPRPLAQEPATRLSPDAEPRAAEGAAGHGRDYAAGLADKDPAVRQEVLLAAAWTRQPWLLDHCRRRATPPTPEHWPELWMLAVLGATEDLPLIRKAVEEPGLGPRRLSLAGSYGRPALVDLLLREMEAADPATAHAAGAAFARITGCEVWSDRTATAEPAGGAEADRFGSEFLGEVTLPSRVRAEEHWRTARGDLSGNARRCRGIQVSGSSEESLPESADLEGLYEVEIWRRYSTPRTASIREVGSQPRSAGRSGK